MDEEASREQPPAGVGGHLAALRMRRSWIIGVTALVVITGFGFTYARAGFYLSEAQVLVRPVAAARAGTAERLNMTTERELARSASVAILAAEQIGMDGASRSFSEPLTVEVILPTEILSFRYTHAEAAVAQVRAQAFAAAYIEFRQRQVREEAAAGEAALRAEIALQERSLQIVNGRLAAARDPVRIRALQAEQGALAGEIGSLLTRLSQVRSTSGARVAQIVQPAFLPAAPSRTPPAGTAALTLFVGLSLGIAAALLAGRLDDRVHDAGTLEATLDVPTLSVVPRISQRMRAGGMVTMRHPAGPFAETYRAMRTGLQFAAGSRDARTIVVTSPLAGDGKTMTTANLGIAMAQSGKRVVLVSADLHRPELHKHFDLPVAPGLSDLVSDGGDVWATMRQPEGLDTLWVLASGSATPSPADVLSPAAMGSLLRRLRDSADIVLVDTGPILSVADVMILVPWIDGVVLVASPSTTRSSLRQTRRRLDLVGATLLGSVLNNVRARRGSGGNSAARRHVRRDRKARDRAIASLRA